MISEKRLREIEEETSAIYALKAIPELIAALREKNAREELGALVERLPIRHTLERLTDGEASWVVADQVKKMVVALKDTPLEALKIALGTVEKKG
jgi:hypothetical protein